MTNEEILEKQVEALEKLLQLKQAIVEELEAKIQKIELEKSTILPWVAPSSPTFVPSVWTNDPCTDGAFHNYPNPWMGIYPPACTKCGKQPITKGTVISSNEMWLNDDKITLTNTGKE